MTDTQGRRVAALVLSHNAPESLARCLGAIAKQTSKPEVVVVVDNASEPPIDASALSPAGAPVRVLRSDVNGGPAGGWAVALREFLQTECTLAWVMDDDIVPEPGCLAALVEAASEGPLSLLVPLSIQPDGSVGRYGSWCGILIAREIVDAVGLPMEELFWWAEDTEYCHWRIPQAGFPHRVVDGAVVHHHAIRQGGDVPTWKYYYEARNMLYYHLHVMHRKGRYPRNFSKLLGRALFQQKQQRAACFAAIGRGLFDGATGRLGIRFPVSPLQERKLESGRGLAGVGETSRPSA